MKTAAETIPTRDWMRANGVDFLLSWSSYRAPVRRLKVHVKQLARSWAQCNSQGFRGQRRPLCGWMGQSTSTSQETHLRRQSSTSLHLRGKAEFEARDPPTSFVRVLPQHRRGLGVFWEAADEGPSCRLSHRTGGYPSAFGWNWTRGKPS